MKTALITGITGQDGAYLSRLLLEKGYKVVGLTRNNRSANLDKLRYLKIENQVSIDECDLSDLSSVINVLQKYCPDEIYNLAAQSSVGLSFAQPIGTIQFNIISVLNLLEAVRLTKLPVKIYQASSSEMYGQVNHLPVTLNTPMHPLSPYAISKSAAFWTTTNYRESYGLFACNGVLFNHESHLRGSNFFVKKVIRETIRNKDVENWVLEVGNLSVKRDFGYSPKYVEAMWLMLQQVKPQDFIICSGTSVSLRDIVHHIFERLNVSLERVVVRQDLMRPNEILDIYGDNTGAKMTLGWNYNFDFFDVLDLLIEEEAKDMGAGHE